MGGTSQQLGRLRISRAGNIFGAARVGALAGTLAAETLIAGTLAGTFLQAPFAPLVAPPLAAFAAMFARCVSCICDWRLAGLSQVQFAQAIWKLHIDAARACVNAGANLL